MLDADELQQAATRALSDPNVTVRRTAVTLFGRIAPDRALPNLMKMLRPDDDDPVVLQAVASQAESSFDAFVDLTLGLGLGGRELVIAARVARYIHHPRLPSLLPPMAQSRAPEVRQALGELWRHRPELIDAALLGRLAQDPVVPVRIAAARAWAAAGRAEGLAALVTDPDPAVRREAALGFARPGLDAAAALKTLAADPEPEVQAAAVVAGLLRGEIETVPSHLPRALLAAAAADVMDREALRSMATDPDPVRRRAGAVTLAVLGDAVARRIATEDPVPAIRKAVRAALPEA
jgi:HEAT repeat protein